MKFIISGASRDKDHSVLLRILTNYFQVVILVKDLELQWPSRVESMLSLLTFLSSITGDIF